MATTAQIDWTDVDDAAAREMSNWRRFHCFVWFRASELDDPDSWAVFYLSGRDAGLLDQSNHAEITKRLAPFMEGDDPDVVEERHSHWAVGFLDGVSLRVFRPDGTITPAFMEWCRIKDDLDGYPVLNETDYSEREYEAALDNYASEMWSYRNELPAGWESAVYQHFSDHGLDRYTENRDDQGAFAPREAILEALEDLGLLPSVTVDN